MGRKQRVKAARHSLFGNLTLSVLTGSPRLSTHTLGSLLAVAHGVLQGLVVVVAVAKPLLHNGLAPAIEQSDFSAIRLRRAIVIHKYYTESSQAHVELRQPLWKIYLRVSLHAATHVDL